MGLSSVADRRPRQDDNHNIQAEIQVSCSKQPVFIPFITYFSMSILSHTFNKNALCVSFYLACCSISLIQVMRTGLGAIDIQPEVVLS